MTETACEQALISVLKSAAPAIGTALGDLIKGIFSATNISKCFSCGNTKTKDDSSSKSTTNNDKDSTTTKDSKSTDTSQPVNKDPTSSEPTSDFVDYPEKFTESAGTAAQSTKVTKWDLKAK